MRGVDIHITHVRAIASSFGFESDPLGCAGGAAPFLEVHPCAVHAVGINLTFRVLICVPFAVCRAIALGVCRVAIEIENIRATRREIILPFVEWPRPCTKSHIVAVGALRLAGCTCTHRARGAHVIAYGRASCSQIPRKDSGTSKTENP